MGARWFRLVVVVCAVLLGELHPCGAANIDLNWEYKQQGAGPLLQLATDFDVFFMGDVRARIAGGGTDAMTNAFPVPMVQTSLPDGTNTRVRFFSGNRPDEGGNIPPDANSGRHFGISATEELKAFRKSWTYGANAINLPEVQTSFLFNPTTNQLLVTAVNLTADTVTVSEAGYLAATTAFALQDLNRSRLPPSAFLQLPTLNDEYLPGQSRSVFVTGVSASDFIVTFGTFAFSGASSGNLYTLDGSEWTQINVRDATIPEPATLPLLCMGALIFACLKRNPEITTSVRNE